MFSKFITKLAIFALNRADISIYDRSKLTNCILNSLAALPLRDIISIDKEGKLLVNGRRLELEEARKLRESARGALNSYARQFVQGQLLHEAIKIALHTSVKIEDTMFGKAAVWMLEQEEIFFRLLAQVGDDEREIAP